ncbi:hypothetical protein LJY25_02590 [Hymenobacter sp. BT175]|uniref:hypothetical protein n=1 Tax=Hymenobacter translucens TaxID=2886507 RepID=UPI001D0E1412|nr:hypothetical protein [Hymenobacter translucens]MCC2545318.1 hypothetical protein [Hymenobacter translucens]
MSRIAIFILVFLKSMLSYGQVENRWLPDSVYKDKKVKKVYVYENSPKDLLEIARLDRNGRVTRIEKYSASYNKRTRTSKVINIVTICIYDSLGKINQKIDTIFYRHNKSVNTEKTYFVYENGLLISSKYFKGDFKNPSSETFFSYRPFTSTTVNKKDTLITYRKTKEYDRDFYVKRFYGYVLEAKLKRYQSTVNGVIETMQYSDENDRQRFDDDKVLKNTFNERGQLVKSEIKSMFMNDRINEYILNYSYYENGLLKSIRGYVPLYYKYEYFD